MLSKVDWSVYFRLEYFVKQQIAFYLSKDLGAPPSTYMESLLVDFCAVRVVYDMKGWWTRSISLLTLFVFSFLL